MAQVKLNVAERRESGSAAARRMRSDGIIPGIVYGKAAESLPVKVDTKYIRAIKKGGLSENDLVTLVIKENNGQKLQKTVIIKEIQRDVLKGDLLHIDFNEISMKERLKMKVRLDLAGEAKGMVQGGVLDHIMHELEIECLPADIPEHIIVDITDLEIGHTIYVKGIVIPEKVILLSDPELPVVSVSAPKVEEEPVPEAEEGEPEEPEVIGKGKKEEEGEEAEAEGKEQKKGEKKEGKKEEKKEEKKK